MEDDFKCGPVFKVLDATLKERGPELVKKINGIYCFKVSYIDAELIEWNWNDLIFL